MILIRLRNRNLGARWSVHIRKPSAYRIVKVIVEVISQYFQALEALLCHDWAQDNSASSSLGDPALIIPRGSKTIHFSYLYIESIHLDQTLSSH